MIRVDSLNSGSDTSISYLDMSCIKECVPLTAIAFVDKAFIGVSKYDSGFITFVLRDVNANLVTARLFDVEDFMLSGVKLAGFIKKPVKLKFIVQEYRGSLSIIIDKKEGIELYHGDFDYDKFIGKIECNTDSLIKVGKAYGPEGWELNPRFARATFDSIGKGRAGAFLKIMDIAKNTLLGFGSIDGVNKEELLRTFLISMDSYFTILENQNKYGDVHKLLVLDDFHTINQRFEGDNCKLLVIDTIKALSGTGKPLSLEAHLISTAVYNAIKGLDLILVNNTIPINVKTSVGGVDLLRI